MPKPTDNSAYQSALKAFADALRKCISRGMTVAQCAQSVPYPQQFWIDYANAGGK